MATKSVPAPSSVVTPVSAGTLARVMYAVSACRGAAANRPCTGRSSDVSPGPAAQPVCCTAVPGAAPVTRWIRTSVAPCARTTLMIRTSPTACREAAQPSPAPSGSMPVRGEWASSRPKWLSPAAVAVGPVAVE